MKLLVSSFTFCLDPPYWGGERDYGKGLFERADFARLAELLGKLKRTFILSLNDRPEIRKIFAGFRKASIETTYTVAGNTNARRARELIITPGRRRRRA